MTAFAALVRRTRCLPAAGLASVRRGLSCPPRRQRPQGGGIGRAAAGIAWHHRQAGIDPSPTAHEGVKQTMRGIRRTIGSAKQGKEPIVADMLMKMLKHCEGDALIKSATARYCRWRSAARSAAVRSAPWRCRT